MPTLLAPAIPPGVRATADTLYSDYGGIRCELVRGIVYPMPPAGPDHGETSLDAGSVIRQHVKSRKLGKAYGAETGFLIERDPDTVLAPDVAFVRTERVVKIRRGFFPGPPDLAVEVVSPDERPTAVRKKVRQWLDAGCQMVWVIDPRKRTVVVYRPGLEPEVLGEEDELVGHDVLPGFVVPVAEVLPTP